MATPSNTLLTETQIWCSTDGGDLVPVTVGELLAEHTGYGAVMLVPDRPGAIGMAPAIARALACQLTLAAERAEMLTRAEE